jgi:hypothetical protein
VGASTVTDAEQCDRTTPVWIKKENHAFVVRMNKKVDGNEKTFSNNYSELIGAVKFLEQNSAVGAGN